MDQSEKIKLLRALSWDYNIPVEDLDALLTGSTDLAGHYDKHKLFIKILETYPWFTILQLYPIKDITELLTEKAIMQLRQPSLRKQYEFIKKRLQEIISVSG